MDYFLIMLKISGLALIYPVVLGLVFTFKNKDYKISTGIKGTILISILNAIVILLLSFIPVYLFQVKWYATPVTLIISNAVYLFIASLFCLLYKNDFNYVTIIGTIVVTALGLVTFVGLNIGYADNMAYTAKINKYKATTDAPMPEIDTKTKELPVVNSNKTVRVIANNSISQVKNSNVYNIDHMRVQYYRGELKYIVPLDFDGGRFDYFKYTRYNEVPGYLIVDATKKDPQVKYIKKSLKYTPSAFFSNDVKRLMYKKVANQGLTISNDSPQLEITDNNEPYYVTTAFKDSHTTSLIDFSQFWVVTVNAINGKTNLYKVQDKPKWLDIAITPNIALKELKQYIEYRNGWWNLNGFAFSYKYGVSVPVEDVGTEADSNTLTPISYKGKIYYFATLTSYKSEQTSVQGYAYIDAETGKMYLYREKGNAMTPNIAETYAKNRMRQYKFKATMPLLYRIDGKPTWVVSMVDNKGAFMKYVYLEANGNGTQDTVAIGNNAKDTLDNYRALFKGGVSAVDSSNAGKSIKRKGVIDRVARYNNNTVRFMLKGNSSVYSVSISKMPQAIFLEPGDKVSIIGKAHDSIITVESMNTK